MTSLLDQELPYQDPDIIFPLIILVANELGLTFYTFPKHHFTPESRIKEIYQYNINLLEELKKLRSLTKKEEYELSGLKHNSHFDPRYANVCYGTLQDTEYAIEIATNLDSYNQDDYLTDNSYLCDWHAHYDFESTCVMTTPDLTEQIEQITKRERKPYPKPHYSDYHFLPDMKIEILPGDQIIENTGIIEPSDRFILVLRPIGTKFVMNMQKSYFTRGFVSHMQELSVEDALKELIREGNWSSLCYMGEPLLAPESGSMLLAVYIKEKEVAFAQVGPIKLKQKIDGTYVEQTEDHTFNNAEERYKSPYKGFNACLYFNKFALDIGFYKDGDYLEEDMPLVLMPNIPSRFTGHPSYCQMDETIHTPAISAIPFIKTISRKGDS